MSVAPSLPHAGRHRVGSIHGSAHIISGAPLAAADDIVCPVCGSSRGPMLHPYAVDFPGRTTRLCAACSAVFVSPLPSQSELSALYAGDYYRHHPAGQAGGAFLDARGQKMIDPEQQADWIQQHARPSPWSSTAAFVDVGCGGGGLASALLRLGAVGTLECFEPDAKLAKVASQQMELAISSNITGRQAGVANVGQRLLGPRSPPSPPPSPPPPPPRAQILMTHAMFNGQCALGPRASLVVASHVLEHVLAPRDFLLQIVRSCLKVDGHLFFAVPYMPLSKMNKTYGAKPRHNFHITYLSEHSVTRLVELVDGLNLVRLEISPNAREIRVLAKRSGPL
jgi:SAM-dependent methyltransferase